MDFDKLNPYCVTLYFTAAIFFTMIFMHPAFIAVNVISSSLACLCICKDSFLKSLKYKTAMFALITFVNPFFTSDGETVLFRIFVHPYTAQALLYGAVLGGIFFCSVNWFSCFGNIIGTDKFMYMTFSRLPTLCTVLSTVIGLIPFFEKKLAEISDIQTPLFKGRKKLYSILNSFNTAVSFSFEHAVLLSFSMKNRGYGSVKPTRYRTYRFTVYDFCLILFSVTSSLAVILFGFSCGTRVEILPSVKLIPFGVRETVGLISYTVLLMIPFIYHISEEIRWNYLMSKI